MPLGFALPAEAITGVLTVLQRVAVAPRGLGAGVAPVGICVSKVPLPRLRHDSWAQMRGERRFARDRLPVGRKAMAFGFGRSYPVREVEKWVLASSHIVWGAT